LRVAVAGATGVLGRALIPQLLSAGYDVLGMVRDQRKAQELFAGTSPGKVEFAEADLLERGLESRLPAICAGCHAVIQAATAIPSDPSALGAWDRNTQIRIRGTGRLQRAVLEANVGTFLLQSVVMAYPDGGDQWLDETTHIDSSPARRAIAHPVAIMESMIYLFGRQPKPIRWCILKGGLFVGEGTGQDRLLARLRTGQEIVPGNGQNFVSLVNVEDAAAAYVAALERAEPGSVFNICDEPVRYGDYVDRVAEMIHAPRPHRDSSKPCPPSWRCTNQRARRELGWTPKHSIWPRVTESVGGN
jgi:nucleoside-diphosphate-sugar epimerase